MTVSDRKNQESFIQLWIWRICAVNAAIINIWCAPPPATGVSFFARVYRTRESPGRTSKGLADSERWWRRRWNEARRTLFLNLHGYAITLFGSYRTSEIIRRSCCWVFTNHWFECHLIALIHLNGVPTPKVFEKNKCSRKSQFELSKKCLETIKN